MKKISTFLIAALLLAGCGGTTKKLQQGNYDAVVDRTVKKLVRKPDLKDATEMDRAYQLGNERDLERIKFLKMENNPDNYDEIFARYNALKERQRKVRTVTPMTVDGKTFSYQYVDFDAEIVSYKIGRASCRERV